MERHAIYLRIMLWSLGFAACLGVISVLFAAYDLMGRVIGTAVVVGVCAGLMIPISKLIDRQGTRAAGVLGMGIITLDFVLAMLLIWVALVYRQYLEDELTETIASLTVPGFLAVLFLANWQREGARLTCRVGMLTSVAVAVFFLSAAWCRYVYTWWSPIPPTDPGRWTALYDVQEHLGETGVVLGVYGLLTLAVLWGETPGHRKWWRWVGTVAGAVASVMWLVHIWVGMGSPLGQVICSALIAVAAVTTYVNIVGFIPLRADQSWVRTGSVVCTLVTAVALVLYVADDSRLLRHVPEEQLERVGAAGGILASCGSLAMVVLARLNRRVYAEESTTPLSDVEMVCPRCRRRQKAPLGDSVCPGCRLRISIRVEEPRCVTCGYLLIGAVSGRCPECGTPVEAACG